MHDGMMITNNGEEREKGRIEGWLTSDRDSIMRGEGRRAFVELLVPRVFFSPICERLVLLAANEPMRSCPSA